MKFGGLISQESLKNNLEGEVPTARHGVMQKQREWGSEV